MANNPKKQAMERDVRKNKQPFDQGGHFFPKLTTKQYCGLKAESRNRRQNSSETHFVQETLIKQTDTKKVRFARHLELWAEYDRDTGVLARKGCRRTRDYRAFSCRLNKNSPRPQQSVVVSKSAKIPKQKPKVQNIAEAVQSMQRQRHGLKNHPKTTLDKHGRFGAKEARAQRSKLELQQDQIQTDRSIKTDFSFPSTHAETYHLNYEEDVQTFRNNSTSDNCASLYRRLDQVRQSNRSILFPQSAEFKACVQCTLPPLCDDRKTIDERRRLPAAADEERGNTNEYKQNSNKGFGSLVPISTPHIVQLFE